MYAITAKVVETPHGKQFHGDVQAPGEAISKILRPSASDGDLVSQASVGNSEASGRTHASEEFPFDDPVPF